ncbi:cilium assembly protein DZIP1L isoform X6 [Phalacrocorax aristotelis]|uniref:cilium assembly protein DZIP1L isoform X6 n=1 Tax=Phalacrocorax aristotelis TaxID=126867 RepID=UPI003F4C3733
MPFSADIYHPLHQPMPGAVGMPGASPGFTVPVDIPPFYFQPRRVSVDWRRFSAIDVERVAREVDVAALQEHIACVTFCNLDAERCPHCGQPADPILLKVLRMAQLSIEYLLHCQEHLGTSLAMHAQHLQAAHTKLACTQQQAAEQVAQLQGAKEESRRWKKMIAMQQLLLQAGPIAYCKCHLCDKAFMNYSLLQAHVQRRHTEATKAERQKMKQVEKMEDEVEELKAKLWEMQQQLEAEREAEKLRREQKLQELQAREAAVSNLGTLQNDDTEEAWGQTPSQAELQGKWERMAVQLKKENKTLRAAPSQDQRAVMDCIHQQMDALSTHLKEQPQVSKSQEKVIKLLSASKPEVTREVTKVVADEESADREEAALGGRQRLLEALWRNPNLLKQFRIILEEVLEEKLESMGVKRVAKGISTWTYRSLQALVRLQQQQKAEKFPCLLHLRDELVQAVMEKVRRCKKPSTNLPRHVSIIPAQSPKSPRSLCGSQPMTTPAVVQPEASAIPQPAPWRKACSTHSSPRTPWGILQTSKASSTHRGLVPQRSSEAKLGGKKPAPSPLRLISQQEPAVSAVVPGNETDPDGWDLDSLEETTGSGRAPSMMVRISERCLDAVARRLADGVKPFPALSSALPKTIQPTKKLQVCHAAVATRMFSDIISIKKKKKRHVKPSSQLLPISSATGHSLCTGGSDLEQAETWPLAPPSSYSHLSFP